MIPMRAESSTSGDVANTTLFLANGAASHVNAFALAVAAA